MHKILAIPNPKINKKQIITLQILRPNITVTGVIIDSWVGGVYAAIFTRQG
jgi:hypothetical protein